MICPYCGKVDRTTPTPELSRTKRQIGTCKFCGKPIFALPTTKRAEGSQIETVTRGEEREDILTGIYISHEGGQRADKRNGADDIDRDVIDELGNKMYCLEIKERSCSLNAYSKTMFPYAKIKSAKKIITEERLPVYIVIKFVDCWAQLKVDPNKEYRMGNQPFAPRYRPWQMDRQRQIPVEVPVEDELTILPWRDECEEILN